ncbi:MAG: DUF998 domain-containing protein [Nocardioides sp.]
MTQLTTTPTVDCSPAARVTKSLLGYGVIAGPAYVVVSVVQALTRDGFDLTRHQWSLLSNGSLGWIQTGNFTLTGLMLIAMAVGVRRALASGRGHIWAPRLIAAFGVSMIAAAVFEADPALGFPVGTPEGAATISVSGMLHFTTAGVGFTCIAIACFVIGRRYAADGRRDMGRYSRATGLVFLGGFACVASGGGSTVANLIFTAAVIAVFVWTTVISRDLSRHTAPAPAAAAH